LNIKRELFYQTQNKENREFRKKLTKLIKCIKLMVFIGFYNEHIKAELEKNVKASEDNLLKLFDSNDVPKAYSEIGRLIRKDDAQNRGTVAFH